MALPVDHDETSKHPCVNLQQAKPFLLVTAADWLKRGSESGPRAVTGRTRAGGHKRARKSTRVHGAKGSDKLVCSPNIQT